MRVLVRLPSWIGDAVMATPALRAIRAGFPGDEIVACGRPAIVSMLEAASLFDRAIPLAPKDGGLLGPIRLGRALAAERFALAILFPNSWSSALTAFAARIRRRVGYGKDGRGILLTTRLRAIRVGRLRPVPMAEYYLALARAAGCPTERTGRHLELPVTPGALERAEAYHIRCGFGRDERPVALAAGAAFGPSKRWTAAGWAAVIDHFLAAGRRVILYGGPDDFPVAREILAAAKRPGAVVATDVPLADLAAHMKRCAVLISTDSGGRHFGVAAGIPVVVIIGSTHPNYSEVDSDRYAVILEKVECWPCHLRRCPIDHRCMTRIEPARVIAAAEDYLAGRKPFGGARPWMTRPGEENARWALDGPPGPAGATGSLYIA